MADPGPDRRQPAVVLIACDDPGARELLARVVEREGGRAEQVADADAALERAGSALPRAVLVDLRHGGLGSALALLDRLRSHADERVASTTVVVIEDAGNGRAVLASGADVHLSRPVHVGHVVAALSGPFSTPGASGAGA